MKINTYWILNKSDWKYRNKNKIPVVTLPDSLIEFKSSVIISSGFNWETAWENSSKNCWKCCEPSNTFGSGIIDA